ncbi:hypothetical protein D1AOALGA4SA_8883 [Olavius algarvensis Delta 1 endosymbiont]|nr:hypothetical protein D1AOALGA4SA_8883 [Olavius algarvensis Delta 1 endosymbiont]
MIERSDSINPQSAIRNPQSVIRNQKSEIRFHANLQLF